MRLRTITGSDYVALLGPKMLSLVAPDKRYGNNSGVVADPETPQA